MAGACEVTVDELITMVLFSRLHHTNEMNKANSSLSDPMVSVLTMAADGQQH
jgi:hypothetical protein